MREQVGIFAGEQSIPAWTFQGGLEPASFATAMIHLITIPILTPLPARLPCAICLRKSWTLS